MVGVESPIKHDSIARLNIQSTLSNFLAIILHWQIVGCKNKEMCKSLLK